MPGVHMAGREGATSGNGRDKRPDRGGYAGSLASSQVPVRRQ